VQPTSTQAGSSISASPTVQILDTLGNLTTSTASVTVAIGTNPSSGTLAGTLTVNASSGVATFAGLSINKIGTGYTLTAASAGLTGATSSPFNITLGSAKGIILTGAFSSGTTFPATCSGTVGSLTCNVLAGTIGSSRSFGGVITLVDLGGNPVANSGSSISVAMTGTVAPSPISLTIANGATSSGSFIEQLPSGSASRSYTATATVAGVTVTVSGSGS